MFLQKSVLKFLGHALVRSGLVLVLFVLLLTGVFSYTRVGTPGTAYAATSSNLNFQARLLNAAGNTVPDGTTTWSSSSTTPPLLSLPSMAVSYG